MVCHAQLSHSKLHVQAQSNLNGLSAAAGVGAEVKTLLPFVKGLPFLFCGLSDLNSTLHSMTQSG